MNKNHVSTKHFWVFAFLIFNVNWGYSQSVSVIINSLPSHTFFERFQHAQQSDYRAGQIWDTTKERNIDEIPIPQHSPLVETYLFVESLINDGVYVTPYGYLQKTHGVYQGPKRFESRKNSNGSYSSGEYIEGSGGWDGFAQKAFNGRKRPHEVTISQDLIIIKNGDGRVRPSDFWEETGAPKAPENPYKDFPSYKEQEKSILINGKLIKYNEKTTITKNQYKLYRVSDMSGVGTSVGYSTNSSGRTTRTADYYPDYLFEYNSTTIISLNELASQVEMTKKELIFYMMEHPHDVPFVDPYFIYCAFNTFHFNKEELDAKYHKEIPQMIEDWKNEHDRIIQIKINKVKDEAISYLKAAKETPAERYDEIIVLTEEAMDRLTLLIEGVPSLTEATKNQCYLALILCHRLHAYAYARHIQEKGYSIGIDDMDFMSNLSDKYIDQVIVFCADLGDYYIDIESYDEAMKYYQIAWILSGGSKNIIDNINDEKKISEVLKKELKRPSEDDTWPKSIYQLKLTYITN